MIQIKCSYGGIIELPETAWGRPIREVQPQLWPVGEHKDHTIPSDMDEQLSRQVRSHT